MLAEIVLECVLLLAEALLEGVVECFLAPVGSNADQGEDVP
jgi:hypothetical protein